VSGGICQNYEPLNFDSGLPAADPASTGHISVLAIDGTPEQWTGVS